MRDDTFIRDPQPGVNQTGLRDQNARLVLTYLRHHGAMPSAEIARRSGLSAQTVSNIMRALEADNLVQRGDAVKGKVGKPSVPMHLNHEGVFSLGLHIGRRMCELVLVNFDGVQVDGEAITYAFPDIETIFGFVRGAVAALSARNPKASERIAGVGVARPNRIWDWLELVDAPEAAMAQWRDLDLQTALAEATGYPVSLENDATSACIAEHLLGRGREFEDFAYVFLGSFVGGGLVLGGKVVSGPTLGAGAIGPILVPDGSNGMVQLLEVASLGALEAKLTDIPPSSRPLRRAQTDWASYEPHLSDWIATTGHYLAIACTAIASVVEVEAVLIDGAFPEDVRARLAAATAEAFQNQPRTGLEALRIEDAIVGRRARSLGAALLPIHDHYFLG